MNKSTKNAKTKKSKTESRATSDEPRAVCFHHPDREAIMKRGENYICWECAVGKEACEKRFSKDFYAPGGAGLISREKAQKTQK
jgi:hypothetical protein